MKTLYLEPASWDLTLDQAGNIRVADGAYAQTQDAASAIKLFQGELYYDTTQGIPYWDQILGHQPPLSLMKEKFVQAALSVPGVTAARCFISSIEGRTVAGQVQITNLTGQTATANF